MEEIKVGEYVRTREGEIGRVYEIKNENTYSKYKTRITTKLDYQCKFLKREDIVKHSFSLIDIIEKRRLCKWL